MASTGYSKRHLRGGAATNQIAWNGTTWVLANRDTSWLLPATFSLWYPERHGVESCWKLLVQIQRPLLQHTSVDALHFAVILSPKMEVRYSNVFCAFLMSSWTQWINHMKFLKMIKVKKMCMNLKVWSEYPAWAEGLFQRDTCFEPSGRDWLLCPW